MTIAPAITGVTNNETRSEEHTYLKVASFGRNQTEVLWQPYRHVRTTLFVELLCKWLPILSVSC